MSKVSNIVIIVITVLAFSCNHLRSDSFNARHYLNLRHTALEAEHLAANKANNELNPIRPHTYGAKPELEDTSLVNLLSRGEIQILDSIYCPKESIDSVVEEAQPDSVLQIQPLNEKNKTDEHTDTVNQIYKYNRMGFLLGTLGFIIIGASILLVFFSTWMWVLSIILGAGLLIAAQVYFIKTIQLSKNLDTTKPDLKTDKKQHVNRRIKVAKFITVFGALIDIAIFVLFIINFH